MKQTKIQLASPNDCTACAACVSVCPKQCISMSEDKEGFLQPRIDASVCIDCHKCEKVCPIINPLTIPDNFETQAYAAINQDESIRLHSSSGGIFYVFSKWIIDQGGVVFGVKFNEQWEVVHDYAETLENVKPFMRSKYVQSRVGDTCKLAKDFLDNDRYVLYSGTPCQINGLKSYLGRSYDKLLTIDFICHGVPSPGVWRKYLQETFDNCGKVLMKFDFRDKSDGWLSQQCNIISYTNVDSKKEKLLENAYFRGFRKDIYLRNSCYHCTFRKYHRISDITIADFWGVDVVCPAMFDNKGTSITFLHSELGLNAFLAVASNLKILKQNRENATKGNRGIDLLQPISTPWLRKMFYVLFRMLSFYSSMRIVDGIMKLRNINRKRLNKIKRLFKLK